MTYTIAVLILLASCQQTCMTYNIAVCTVKKTPDDGQRNCPKHVEFYSKNKFEELVHLVGFVIRNIITVPLGTGSMCFAGSKKLICKYYLKELTLKKNTCFGQFICPSSGVFHSTHNNGIRHTGLLTACEQDQFRPDPARKLYDIYHCCAYSEKNS